MLKILFLVGAMRAATAQVCHFAEGDYHLSWKLVGDSVIFHLRHRVPLNQWTGVGFGNDLDRLDFILVEVSDQPRIVDTSISKWDPMFIEPDGLNSVETLYCVVSNNTVRASFRRPLKGGGANRDLSQCIHWQFPIYSGELVPGQGIGRHPIKPVSVPVCAHKCRTQFNTRIPTPGEQSTQLLVEETTPTVNERIEETTVIIQAESSTLPSLPPRSTTSSTLPSTTSDVTQNSSEMSTSTLPSSTDVISSVQSTQIVPVNTTDITKLCSPNALADCARNFPKILENIMRQLTSLLRQAHETPAPIRPVAWN